MLTKGRLDKPIEFVSVGHLAIDYRAGRRVLGGAAAYSCITASRLGLASAMVTAVGADFDLFEPLAGIEIHYHCGDVSTSFENIYVGAERRQKLKGLARPLIEEDLAGLQERLADDAVVLYCPIAGEVRAPLRRLASRGLCGVTPQGFFRRWDEEGSVCQTPWIEAREQLVGVDFLSTSIADPPSPEELREQLADLVGVLVMTEGERGAQVQLDGCIHRIPAYRREAVDPTGAGDVFAASFLVALRDGMEPLQAAQFASSAASFVVERDGVEGIPPGRNSVEERLGVCRESASRHEVSGA